MDLVTSAAKCRGHLGTQRDGRAQCNAAPPLFYTGVSYQPDKTGSIYLIVSWFTSALPCVRVLTLMCHSSILSQRPSAIVSRMGHHELCMHAAYSKEPEQRKREVHVVEKVKEKKGHERVKDKNVCEKVKDRKVCGWSGTVNEVSRQIIRKHVCS